MSCRLFPLAFAFVIVLAASAGAASKPAAAVTPQPRPKPEWNVCTEVLMAAMPLEKMLPLLPELRDPAKAEATVAQLLAAIQRKEALLTGYPVVYSDDGQRGVSESYLEKRYPTQDEANHAENRELQSFPTPDPTPRPSSAPSPVGGMALPTEFETRNIGVTLEVEPRVQNGGKSIQLNIIPKNVSLVGFTKYQAARAENGGIIQLAQPQFADSIATTSVTVTSGQYTLIGVHLIPKPENYMEVFILRATAIPIP